MLPTNNPDLSKQAQKLNVKDPSLRPVSFDYRQLQQQSYFTNQEQKKKEKILDFSTNEQHQGDDNQFIDQYADNGQNIEDVTVINMVHKALSQKDLNQDRILRMLTEQYKVVSKLVQKYQKKSAVQERVLRKQLTEIERDKELYHNYGNNSQILVNLLHQIDDKLDMYNLSKGDQKEIFKKTIEGNDKKRIIVRNRNRKKSIY